MRGLVLNKWRFAEVFGVGNSIGFLMGQFQLADRKDMGWGFIEEIVACTGFAIQLAENSGMKALARMTGNSQRRFSRYASLR
jgi:hypothetical protein